MNKTIKKTLSYKLISNAIGITITYLYLGSLEAATTLTLIHLVVSTGVFYLHERVWERK